MKSGEQQITGFMKCIIFHSNMNQQLNSVEFSWFELSWAHEPYVCRCRLCVLWVREKKPFSFSSTLKRNAQVCLKWNETSQQQQHAHTHTHQLKNEEREKTTPKRQRTYALIWFDGWCVKIHGFCYCIWFPPFFSLSFILYNVRPSASTSISNLDRMHSQCIHLNVLSKCSKKRNWKRFKNEGKDSTPAYV